MSGTKLYEMFAGVPENTPFAMCIYQNKEGRLQLAATGAMTWDAVALCLYNLADTVIDQRCVPMQPHTKH